MGTAPVEQSEVQDELSAALEASNKPGMTEVEPEPEPEPIEEKKEEPVVKPTEKTEDAKATEKPEAEKKDDLFSVDEQNRELRQILRQQKRDIQVMQAKLGRLEKRSLEATKEAEKEVEEEDLFSPPKKTTEKTADVEEVSQVERIQQEILTIAKAKGPVLETLLEVMEVNPAYADVKEVCSQSNFDDIFEAVGEAIAAKEGKDASIAALEAEAAVWKMANPYKYMYGLIKQYHPKYAGRQPKTTKEDTTEKKAVKKPVEAPSSIADKSGKSTPSNAWSSARIDEMDELELDKVPHEIYEKYLRGELD